jgi:hypothetical protein
MFGLYFKFKPSLYRNGENLAGDIYPVHFECFDLVLNIKDQIGDYYNSEIN